MAVLLREDTMRVREALLWAALAASCFAAAAALALLDSSRALFLDAVRALLLLVPPLVKPPLPTLPSSMARRVLGSYMGLRRELSAKEEEEEEEVEEKREEEPPP